MSTIFSKIINRELPGFFIYEDDVCAVFLDKFPAVLGQAIIAPRVETAYIFDLPDETYLHICAIAKIVAQALDSVYQTERTCLVVEGFDVPHVHIKLYPLLTTAEPLGAIMHRQNEADDTELAAAALRIQSTLEEQVTE